MNRRLHIVAVKYDEPDWIITNRCISQSRFPVHYVDRKGVGSLAEALNRGFNYILSMKNEIDLVWFVTNVTFNPDLPTKLITQMAQTGYAAITPAFRSDHPFIRPVRGCSSTLECPMIEFTAPIVRVSVFKQFPLDENMPYWGHDLDWSHRVRQAHFKLGVYHGGVLGHEYIRNNRRRHPITMKRAALRVSTNVSTRVALEKKYGPNWREVIWSWQK